MGRGGRPGPRDELLQPTVARSTVTTERPWRVESQVYVAFFGGAIAVTTIAWLNARRLGLPNKSRLAILGVGTIALIATIVLALGLTSGDAENLESSNARLIGRVAAVIGYVVMARIQAGADRVYRFREGENYESLWGAGISAAIVGGLLQAVLIAGTFSAR